MRTLARWCCTHRRWVLAAWLVLLGALTAVSMTVGSSYASSFGLPNTDSARAIKLLQAANPAQSGDTEFVVMSGEKEVASFTTGADGTFRVLLPPGQYSVRKKNHQTGIGRYGPFDAFVSAGEMTKVEWNCDSGMR